jgi:hypothetical protein
MNKSAVFKSIAALSLGLAYHAFGACTVIVSNYTLPYDVSGCYDIYGANVVFDGNLHKITGSSAQTSNTIITIHGYGTTVKNVDIDCNTKVQGIWATSAGSSLNASNVRINNCTYGVFNANSGINVSGREDGGNNFMNNAIDIVSIDARANHTYTSYLDSYGNNKAFGIYTDTAPFYDYSSIIYGHQTGLLAYSNTFFWLNQTFFFFNKNWDMDLNNIPAAYMTNVHNDYGKLKKTNTNIIVTN